MPALAAAGAGVEVDELAGGVADDFEDVGVAADEEAGPAGVEFGFDAAFVSAGVAADVGHVDAKAFAFPAEVAREFVADFVAVDIAVDAAERFAEGLEGSEHIGAEVTGVPEFVDFGEVFEDGGVEETVGVGEETDAHFLSYFDWILT